MRTDKSEDTGMGLRVRCAGSIPVCTHPSDLAEAAITVSRHHESFKLTAH